jgi:hypothetical protein
MRKASDPSREIELHWQQRDIGEWQAVMVDRESGRSYAVRNAADLWTTLNRMLQEPPEGTTAEQQSYPGQSNSPADLRPKPRRGHV